MKKVTAFVFAAGLGTRLYPLTASRPKAMVRYRGVPLLGHALEKIACAGIKDVVVNVHHFPDQIMDYLSENTFGLNIRISDERAYLRDTAGGLKFAEPLLGDGEILMLYNVDILTSIDLRQMLQCHLDRKADVTLAVKKRETKRYFIFDESQMRMCGWKNLSSGETLCPLPTEHPVDLAFSGIHLMNRQLVQHIPTVEKFSLTPFYIRYAADFNISGYLHQNDEWMDVGKYEVYSNVLE